MLVETLQNFGLDPKEIAVFLRLLQFGPIRASILAYQMGLPRTTVQNILLRLEHEELATKRFEKNTALYRAIEPQELLVMWETRQRREAKLFKDNIDTFKKIMPELESMMKSNKHLPGVKFYKGLDGVRKVLFDTLTSKTELKDFANIDAMFDFVKDINDEYVAAREKSTVTKRSLLLETPFAHKIYESGRYSPKSHKGYKWLPHKNFFSIEMNIYDGKISYLTYVENDFVGVIIQNDHIYQMHNAMWDLVWESLPSPGK